MGSKKRKKQPIADLPHGIAVGKHPKGWRVRLGKKFTGGKVIERYFPKLSDAETFIATETPRQKQVQAAGLTPAELSEAIAAYDLLRPLGVGLSIAVSSFIKSYIPPDRRKTFNQVAAEFMRDKRKKKKKLKGSTLKSYLGFYRRFSETFSKTPVSQIRAKDIDTWLDDHDFEGINYNNIHLDTTRPVIEITAEQAKTRRRRIVPVQPNLLGWLLFARQAATEPVIPYDPATNAFWDKRDALRKAAGLNDWPRNVLRHSFGSYLLASTHDENLTATQMGNSPDIIVKHYREMVRPEAAEKYWKLSCDQPDNVITLPTVTAESQHSDEPRLPLSNSGGSRKLAV